jgi:hypothetical protein
MNMGLHFPLLTALTVEVCLIGGLLGQTKSAGDAEPDAYTYKRVDGRELQVYVFALDAAIPPETMVEFCEKLKQAKNWCELQIYPGVGHMLEPPQENGTDKEDALRTKYDAYLKADQFLEGVGIHPFAKAAELRVPRASRNGTGVKRVC